MITGQTGCSRAQFGIRIRHRSIARRAGHHRAESLHRAEISRSSLRAIRRSSELSTRRVGAEPEVARAAGGAGHAGDHRVAELPTRVRVRGVTPDGLAHIDIPRLQHNLQIRAGRGAQRCSRNGQCVPGGVVGARVNDRDARDSRISRWQGTHNQVGGCSRATAASQSDVVGVVHHVVSREDYDKIRVARDVFRGHQRRRRDRHDVSCLVPEPTVDDLHRHGARLIDGDIKCRSLALAICFSGETVVAERCGIGRDGRRADRPHSQGNRIQGVGWVGSDGPQQICGTAGLDNPGRAVQRSGVKHNHWVDLRCLVIQDISLPLMCHQLHNRDVLHLRGSTGTWR
mmetsp:Transcript_38664/g.101030  ORF Transcript_38664/g.101030 Transcript_38664/m.101030 type:complete len:343 (+) Transcript_38664:1137-2165(+)